MKIARIVLTASILLSLKSTLFCSEEKATEVFGSLARKDSFDALRDGGALNGWLGWNPDALANYTIDNCGKEYKGKEIRIGSKNTTPAWTTFGQKVDSLPKAQQFLDVIEKSGAQLPAAATAKSNEFITVQNQRIATENEYRNQIVEKNKLIQAQIIAHKIETSERSFIELNQASKASLRELFTQRTVERPATKKAIQDKHEAAKKAELNQYYEQCKATDAQKAKELQENLTKLVAIKTTHNQEFAEFKDQIKRLPFATSEKDLSGNKLYATAFMYRYWAPKSPNSFVEAVKGDK